MLIRKSTKIKIEMILLILLPMPKKHFNANTNSNSNANNKSKYKLKITNQGIISTSNKSRIASKDILIAEEIKTIFEPLSTAKLSHFKCKTHMTKANTFDNEEICQKKCQKQCQKICQKKRQKDCQKICQKECQKIAFSQSVKLRVTGRISGDEFYVYPHLTRPG